MLPPGLKPLGTFTGTVRSNGALFAVSERWNAASAFPSYSPVIG
jgi:hypothetical protein